jgi:hypothetical protein
MNPSRERAIPFDARRAAAVPHNKLECEHEHHDHAVDLIHLLMRPK